MGSNPINRKKTNMQKIQMHNIKKYIYLQTYIFKHLKNLNYSFFHGEEIVTIKNSTVYNARSTGEYNINHAFTQSETCLILEKYVYCESVIRILPLAKYLHLNFTFLKSENPDNYKIKVNYIFATPCFNKNNIMFFAKTFADTKWRKYQLECLFHPNVSEPVPQITKKIKKITLKFFLKSIKNKKFRRTFLFFNFLRPKKTIYTDFAWKISPYNYPNAIESTTTVIGIGDYLDNYKKIIKQFQYPEVSKLNIRTIYETFKILVLNLFIIPENNTHFEFFYFLFYNYMLLKNIYLNTKDTLIQITQTHQSTQNVINYLKKEDLHFETYIIYESLLLPAIPIKEHVLGEIRWLFNNLNIIIEDMERVLPAYIEKNKIFKLIETIISTNQLENLIYFLKIRKLPTRQELLKQKEYSDKKAVYSWTTCMAVFLLKKQQLHEKLPTIYKKMKFFDLDIEEILLYTNIYNDNLNAYSEGIIPKEKTLKPEDDQVPFFE